MSVAAISERIGTIQSLIQELSNPGSTKTSAAKATATSATDFAGALRTLGAVMGNEGGVTGDDIVAQAKQYLGVPYVFGGEDESGMDCSGLVQRVLADLGIDAPRVVQDQAHIGVEVPSLDQAQPGDLIVTKDQGHIVIYAGDGKIIHAPRPGKDVQLVDNYLSPAEIGTIRRVAPAPAEPAVATLSDLPGLSAAPSADLLSVMQVLFAGGSESSDGASLGALSARLAPIAAALEARVAAAATVETPQAAVPTASAVASAVAAAVVQPAQVASDPAAQTRRDDLSIAAATTAAAPAAEPPAAPAPAPTARPALAPQLSPQVVSLAQAGDGDHQITVTVSPDDLGPVTVRAHISGETMRIELLAASDAGRDAIRQILGDLRRDLAAAAPHASLTLTGGDASTSSQSGAGAGSGARDQAPGGAPGQPAPRGSAAPDAAPVPVATPIAAPIPHTATSFDVLA